MKRLFENQLVSWKLAPTRKPLVVCGARQVGKTWAIEQFGTANFVRVVKLDFEKSPALGAAFEGDLSPTKILPQLELLVGQRIIAGETLLFLDEIQACPRALSALRYFHEEMPALHVIAAGSLLEFALEKISVPVGRVSYLQMSPMTFREFLLASGNVPAADALARPPEKFSAAVHAELLDALKTYFFVGGMPACVAAWTRSHSLLEVAQIQDDLMASFRDDFAKYAGRADRACLAAVLQNAARSVGSQINYTRLADAFSGATNRKAFDLLCMARVLQKIPAAAPALPLGAGIGEKAGKQFKAAFLDIGLMQRLCGVPADVEFRQSDLLAIWRGQLAEQFVAQELLAANAGTNASGGGDGGLFYWARDARSSTAEVDFLVQRGGRVQPVEVKSGAAGSLKSLHLLLREHPECADGVVLSCGELAALPEQRLRFLPLYYAGGV